MNTKYQWFDGDRERPENTEKICCILILIKLNASGIGSELTRASAARIRPLTT